MEALVTFGDWLRQRRRALDLTQQELAARVACSADTIRKLEADLRRPSQPMAERIARSLHVAGDELASVLAAARAGRPPLAPAPSGTATRPIALALRPACAAPYSTSPLIGRELELERILAYLRRTDTRLVTLTGPGGIGKTRLAIEVASVARERFAGAVYWVELASLRDPGLVIPTIAQTMGLQEPTLEAVAAYASTGPQLLILDNLEHLLAAAPALGTLLSATPALTLLVTSRIALRIRGEHRIVVPPLPVPPMEPPHSVAGLSAYAAVDLYCARARAANTDFMLTAANGSAVSAICARLEGIPLAIELVAARAHVLEPAALLVRLEQRLSFLVGGPQDAPARQRTMRATIDWSYTLLGAAEQRLFRRLGAFAGEWDLAGAAAVTRCDADLDAMMALVDASLVYRVSRTGVETNTEPRFAMLETLREYALEQLERQGEAASLEAQHATYFLSLAEHAASQLDGEQGAAWLERLEREHDNLRAALAWAAATPSRVEHGVRLAQALMPFWWRNNHLHEARRWLELLLAQSGGAAPTIRAQLLRALASASSPLGEYESARGWLEESLAIARELDDERGVGAALHLLSEVAFASGDRVSGIDYAEQALPRLRASGDTANVAGVLDDLARAALEHGETARGVALLEENLALLRTHGPAWEVADTLETLAGAVRDNGDARRSLQLYREALQLLRRVGSSSAVLGVLVGLVPALHEQGEMAEAARYLEECLIRFRGLKPVEENPEALPWQRRNIAHAAYVVGDKRCAAELLRVSLRTFSQQPAPLWHGVALALQDVAAVLAERGQAAEAAELFGAAKALRGASVVPWGLGERIEYEHAIERVRTQLGFDGWTTALAQGQHLNITDALTKAIAALEDERHSDSYVR
ncbi:MAG TPA: helix-turn-helix domain-containing protein [Chloroflexaceae bacterium]|nr:helix-turn-helix domain-containing protein [Chloroflexaceae bacterium]